MWATYSAYTTHMVNILMEFNSIYPQLKCSIEIEIHKQKQTPWPLVRERTIPIEIHSKFKNLEATITNKLNQSTFGDYRKSTITELIIHNDSYQPYKLTKSTINLPDK
jgi:hypothetical protein